MVAHGGLQQVHALQTSGDAAGGEEHDEGGAAADDDGVDEHAQSLGQAHLHGVIGICGGSSAGGGAGAGLIGEKAPLDTVHQHGAESACHHLPQAEGFLEDQGEHSGQEGDVLDDQKDGDEEVAAGHDGHQDIQNLHRGVLAQHDHRRQQHQCHRGVQGRDMEGVLKGGGDGVADDLADAAPADQAGDGEQHGDDGLAPGIAAPLPGHEAVDEVGGTAPVAAVEGVLLFIELGQRGLDESGGGADQGGDPHPEHSAGAAGGDCRHDANQIAHAHTGRGRYHQRLEGGEGAALCLGPLFQGGPQHIREHADGQEAGADREIDARREQQQHDQGKAQGAAAGKGQRDEVAPEKAVDRFNKGDELGLYQFEHS